MVGESLPFFMGFCAAQNGWLAGLYLGEGGR